MVLNFKKILSLDSLKKYKYSFIIFQYTKGKKFIRLIVVKLTTQLISILFLPIQRHLRYDFKLKQIFNKSLA